MTLNLSKHKKSIRTDDQLRSEMLTVLRAASPYHVIQRKTGMSYNALDRYINWADEQGFITSFEDHYETEHLTTLYQITAKGIKYLSSLSNPVQPNEHEKRTSQWMY